MSSNQSESHIKCLRLIFMICVQTQILCNGAKDTQLRYEIHKIFSNTPSHLFRISRNQAEPAGMKNFQNSRHIREGISNPVTLEAERAGMTAEWKLLIYS